MAPCTDAAGPLRPVSLGAGGLAPERARATHVTSAGTTIALGGSGSIFLEYVTRIDIAHPGVDILIG